MNRVDLALKMLKIGIQNNPKNWWLPYTAGIMELMYNSNFVDATKYFDLAAKIQPKTKVARLDLTHISKVMHSKAKEQEKKREVWMGIYNEAQSRGDVATMERAKKNLKIHGYDISNL